jgi:hypothetical protein
VLFLFSFDPVQNPFNPFKACLIHRCRLIHPGFNPGLWSQPGMIKQSSWGFLTVERMLHWKKK